MDDKKEEPKWNDADLTNMSNMLKNMRHSMVALQTHYKQKSDEIWRLHQSGKKNN